MKILISDAISHNRENLANFLSESGLEVVGTAASGTETLKLAEELNPEIIILDINLPDVDAQETIISLKCSQPTVEIILLMVSHNRNRCAASRMCLMSSRRTAPIRHSIFTSRPVVGN